MNVGLSVVMLVSVVKSICNTFSLNLSHINKTNVCALYVIVLDRNYAGGC